MNNHLLRYMPFDWACKYVQEHKIPNIYQYEKWWAETRPPLPKKPDRVYKEWKGWNFFLHDNKIQKSFEKTLYKFRQGKKVRPLWEALRFSQQMAREHNITTEKMWRQWCDDNPELLPDDIPKWPHKLYDDFPGYPIWLGKTVKAQLARESNPTTVFAIRQVKNNPENCIRPQIYSTYNLLLDDFNDSESQLGKIYQIYKWENNFKSQVDKILNTFAYKQELDNTYIVPNMSQLLWELSNILLIYKR